MREYVRDLPPVVAGQLKIYFGEDVRLVFAAVTDYAFCLKVFHEGLPPRQRVTLPWTRARLRAGGRVPPATTPRGPFGCRIGI